MPSCKSAYAKDKQSLVCVKFRIKPPSPESSTLCLVNFQVHILDLHDSRTGSKC